MANQHTKNAPVALQGENRQIPRHLMYVTDAGRLVCYRDGAGYGQVLMNDGSWLAFTPFEAMPDKAMKVRKP